MIEAGTIQTLADEVTRGLRSRTSIRRSHDKATYFAVQAELRSRDETRRMNVASTPVESEPEDTTIWCAGCSLKQVNEVGERCERCEKEHAWLTWFAETIAEVRRLCAAHGWELNERYSGGFNTRSRYYEVSRECDDDVESFKLRISDHGSAYCSEDISLAMQPSGDDHTLADLERRMSRP